MRQRLPVQFNLRPIGPTSQSVSSSAFSSNIRPVLGTPEGWDFAAPQGPGIVAVEPVSPSLTQRLFTPDRREENSRRPEISPFASDVVGTVGALPTIANLLIAWGLAQQQGLVRVWLSATPDARNGVWIEASRLFYFPFADQFTTDPAQFGISLHTYPQSGVSGSYLITRYKIGYTLDGESYIAEQFDSSYGDDQFSFIEFGLNPFNLWPGQESRCVYAMIVRAGEDRFGSIGSGRLKAGIGQHYLTNAAPYLGLVNLDPFSCPLDDPSGQNSDIFTGNDGDIGARFIRRVHIAATIPDAAVVSDEWPMQTRTTLVQVIPNSSNVNSVVLRPSVGDLVLRNACRHGFTPLTPDFPNLPTGLVPVCVNPLASYAIGVTGVTGPGNIIEPAPDPTGPTGVRGLRDFVPDIADWSDFATKDGPTWHEQALAPHGTKAGQDKAIPTIVVSFPPGVPWDIDGQFLVPDGSEGGGATIQTVRVPLAIGNMRIQDPTTRSSASAFGVTEKWNDIIGQEPLNLQNNYYRIIRNVLASRDIQIIPFCEGRRLLPCQYHGLVLGDSYDFTYDGSPSLGPGVPTPLPYSCSFDTSIETFAMTYRINPRRRVNLTNAEAWQDIEDVAHNGVGFDSFDYWKRKAPEFAEPADARIILDMNISLRLQSVGSDEFQQRSYPPGLQNLYVRLGIRVTADKIRDLANGVPIEGELVGPGFGLLELQQPTPTNLAVSRFAEGWGIYPVGLRMVTA
jgi:hypothetical protein